MKIIALITYFFNLIRRNAKKYRKGLRIQNSVINALFYRELKTRVSEVRFGLLGVFIEPIGVMAIFLIIFSFLRGGRGNGLDTALFLAVGIINYNNFSEIAIRSLNAMRANEALFFYKPVKPVDTVVARSLVETGLFGIAFLVILFGIYIIREQFTLQNFPLLVISYCLLSLTSFGLGLVIMVAGFSYPSLHQIFPLAIRPLWFVSGVFYSVSNIPERLKPFISWNPIIQCIELGRYALSTNYILDDSISLPYLFACSGFTCAFGFWIYFNNEKLLLTR